MNTCIVNIGLYRTGTTTLVEAAKLLHLRTYREFPNLSPETHQSFLVGAQNEIDSILLDVMGNLLHLVKSHDLVCDGYFPLLSLASPSVVDLFKSKAKKESILIKFIVTERNCHVGYLRSELHHWILYDIERKSELEDRSTLEDHLCSRLRRHKDGLERLGDSVKCMDLSETATKWSVVMASVSKISIYDWNHAISSVGKSNSSPKLPIEGILLTMRLGNDSSRKLSKINILLDDIEKDSLCSYLVVIALDDDEYDLFSRDELLSSLGNRPRMTTFHYIRAEKRDTKNTPVPICSIWHQMATCAWNSGASWVIFLGDDIRINCNYHYRAIYRSFLDIRQKLQLKVSNDQMFGSPWFDDIGFKGFPTFPIVGNMHQHIFDGLIPKWHMKNKLFVNQDLDPYLQRMYLKFGAAPLLKNVLLANEFGGSDLNDARYTRISAKNWRQLVISDSSHIENYLRMHHTDVRKFTKVILDVIIPSYRVDVDYLERLCKLNVPSYMATTFIIIIDSPERLKCVVNEVGISTLDVSTLTNNEAASLLEDFLSTMTSNNIRVRCNERNLGASASRNRGIEESAAEYLLFLDDDVIPDDQLLSEYGKVLLEEESEKSILGLVGMVRFPRSPSMPIIHAAVLMSYLTFMFEIAANNIYKEPAWGVTANILFKKVPGLSFDTRYAKSGGGEDVDIALRLEKDCHELSLKACPKAIVHHPFWKGSVYALCKHFFCWAIGDGALFARFPAHTYHSFPNFVETFFLLLVPGMLTCTFHKIFLTVGTMFLADVFVDMCWKWGKEFHHRCAILEYKFSLPYITAAHLVANFYVIVLETGRLYGHTKRGQLSNLMFRFDWHCGRLSHSRERFVQREFAKFVCFVIIILTVLKS